MQAESFASKYLHQVETQDLKLGDYWLIGVEDRVEFWMMLNRKPALM